MYTLARIRAEQHENGSDREEKLLDRGQIEELHAETKLANVYSNFRQVEG